MSNARRQTRASRAPSSAVHQARRRREWASLSAQEILARHPPGTMPPLEVLELLISLFNKEHTALYKKVSFKTRQERAQFLRRFFYDLQHKARFKSLPDPRNLGHRHVKAVVAIWRQEKLAPATIQTYFSYLRGFELWIGKPGLIRPPARYGLKPEEYQRHQAAAPEKAAAIEHAKRVVLTLDGHVGGPSRHLKQAMRRFDYVMWKFGITQNHLGATSHGLRHEALIDEYHRLTGEAAPVRGGAKVPKEIDSSAREDVARLAGHSRRQVRAAYIGSLRARARRRDKPQGSDDEQAL